jgi:hypothetical protein
VNLHLVEITRKLQVNMGLVAAGLAGIPVEQLNVAVDAHEAKATSIE